MPEERPAVVDDRARQGDLRFQPCRIARSGREDHAVDVARQDIGRGGRVGEDPHPRAAMAHRADDVRLQAEVDDADQRSTLPRLAVLGDRRRRDLRHEVLVLPADDRPGRLARCVGIRLAGCRDDAPQRAVGPEVAGEASGVHAGDGRDAVIAQERGELAGILEHGGGRIGDHKGPQPRPARLVVGDEPAVVADERVGHDHDLAGIRGVGADLLVARLARVDHEVAAGRDRCPEGDAREDRPVLQRQQRRTQIPDSGIDDRAGPRRRWDDHATAASVGTDGVGRQAVTS